MYTLIINRTRKIGPAVCGLLNLYAAGNIHIFGCSTLENADYLIPEGEYEGCITFSPRFHSRLPLILVKGRQGIRIHAGNRYHQSRGCILVGSPSVDGILYESKRTLKELMLHLPVKFKVIVSS